MKLNSNTEYFYNNIKFSMYQPKKKEIQSKYKNLDKNYFIKNQNSSFNNLTKNNLESFQIIQHKTFYKIQRVPSFEIINNLRNKRKKNAIYSYMQNKRNNSYEPNLKSIKKKKKIIEAKNLNEFNTNKINKIYYNKKGNIKNIIPDKRNEKFYYINKTQPYKNKSENKNLYKKKRKRKRKSF